MIRHVPHNITTRKKRFPFLPPIFFFFDLLYLLGNCFEGFVVSLLEFFIESRASITLSLCWGVSVFVFLNFSGLYFLLKNCFVELVESSFFLLFR